MTKWSLRTDGNTVDVIKLLADSFVFEDDDRALLETTQKYPNGTILTGNYLSDVANGNVPNTRVKAFFGKATVQEGIGSEQVIGTGQTGRYPFPTVAAQMTVVSTSTDDTAAGTGTRALLIRGIDNSSPSEEINEILLIDGTNPVTTVTTFWRINDIASILVGSTGKNQGTITIKNGTDLLSQITPGDNVSYSSHFSIAEIDSAIIWGSTVYTGKDDNVEVRAHIKAQVIGGIDIAPFDSASYQNQIGISKFFPYKLSPGDDLESTGYSKSGPADVAVLLNLVINENVL